MCAFIYTCTHVRHRVTVHDTITFANNVNIPTQVVFQFIIGNIIYVCTTEE